MKISITGSYCIIYLALIVTTVCFFFNSSIFTKREIEELKKITLWDVIVNSTDILPNEIQRKVFFFGNGDPCPQPEQLNALNLEPCNHLSGYDYFGVKLIKTNRNRFTCNLFILQGNEFAYIYVCVFLCFVPILCASAAYGVVKLQNKRRRQLKLKLEDISTSLEQNLPVDIIVAEEWLHSNHKRCIKIKFGSEVALHIIGRKGEKLRSIDFKNYDIINVEESIKESNNKKPLVLIRVPREHDLVIELKSFAAQKKFIAKLELFLNLHKKSLKCIQVCNI